MGDFTDGAALAAGGFMGCVFSLVLLQGMCFCLDSQRDNLEKQELSSWRSIAK